MIRARFRVNAEDPRPVFWPIKHPYWITGFNDKCATIVAYADDEDYILENWPDATDIDSEESQSYVFSARFAKPEWLDAT